MPWLFLFLVLAVMTLVGPAGGQPDGAGFLSIDCGIADGHSYAEGDQTALLRYVSDSEFTDAGAKHNISSRFDSNSSIATQYRTLRSFPQGRRNCYTLPVDVGQKYLIRARFFHGGYDGRTLTAADPVIFDLHLDVNLWETVNVSSSAAEYSSEVLALASVDYLSICLVNKGFGTPFVSSLELRPVKVNLYPNVTDSVALVLFFRVNFGETTKMIRFPQDPYDRTWTPYETPTNWREVTTDSQVQSRANDLFEVPSAVLQTAVDPRNSTQLIVFWTPPASGNVRTEFHIYMHFSEIQTLALGQSREFKILLNGENYFGPLTPPKLLSYYIWSTNPYNDDMYNFSLVETNASTLPPIINALEAYNLARLTERATYGADVDTIRAIKKRYKVIRNWSGDPCVPKDYTWDGLNCTRSAYDPPRITTLNLSSGGLTGAIDSSFAELKAIEYLDLSNNNLTGEIPAVLAQLPLLVVLDLTNNQLSGLIPSALAVKSQSGSLVLRIEGNPSLCANRDSCTITPTSSRKKIVTPLVVILFVAVIILVLVVIGIFWKLRKLHGKDASAKPHSESGAILGKDRQYGSLQLENRKFTYKELKDITNNFVKVLGEGGFGTVYHGYLEDGSQVAVKMRSQSSSQGAREFLTEAQHLTRVHHRNIVPFVGYCMDGDYQAVVYEYMSQGTLQEHLRGEILDARIFGWALRLQIAIDAAKGLEYLHKMCQPPIIHRDVKTGNILLSEMFEAKIADFGLSKAFQNDLNSHISTKVVGTPGYLDPEYYTTNMLSDKSDVYSFGVVLLELITGKPPALRGSQHIVQWVRQGLAKGKIEDIVDARLLGECDVNSVWKCAAVALKCTLEGAHQRPTITEVLMQLKESLELENPGDRYEITSSEKDYLESGFMSLGNAHASSLSESGGGPSAR